MMGIEGENVEYTPKQLHARCKHAFGDPDFVKLPIQKDVEAAILKHVNDNLDHEIYIGMTRPMMIVAYISELNGRIQELEQRSFWKWLRGN